MASQEQPNERQSEEYLLLKERAKTIGLKVSPNIGLDALRLKVNGALTGQAPSDEEDVDNEEDQDDGDDENEDAGEDQDDVAGDEPEQGERSFFGMDDEDEPTEEVPEARKPSARERKQTEKTLRRQGAQMRARGETRHELTQRLRNEALKLVRVRIHNLNPGKRDLHGEFITIGNKYIGTVRKLIPFGEESENGYHIPQIILDDLRQRKYQAITTKRVDGQIKITSRLAPEYNIEILEPLTPEELRELAMKQAAAQRMQGS